MFSLWAKPEDECHYLFECPNFATHRTGLVGTIAGIVRNVDDFAFNICPVTKLDYDGLTSLALFGNSHPNDDNNNVIFDAVQQYIIQTKRF